MANQFSLAMVAQPISLKKLTSIILNRSCPRFRISLPALGLPHLQLDPSNDAAVKTTFIFVDPSQSLNDFLHLRERTKQFLM